MKYFFNGVIILFSLVGLIAISLKLLFLLFGWKAEGKARFFTKPPDRTTLMLLYVLAIGCFVFVIIEKLEFFTN